MYKVHVLSEYPSEKMLTSTKRHSSVGDIEVDGFDDGTPEEEGDTLGGGVSSMQCKKPVPLQIEVVSEREENVRGYVLCNSYDEMT